MIGARDLSAQQFQLGTDDPEQLFMFLTCFAKCLNADICLERFAYGVEPMSKASVPTVRNVIRDRTGSKSAIFFKRCARFHEHGLHDVLPTQKHSGMLKARKWAAVQPECSQNEHRFFGTCQNLNTAGARARAQKMVNTAHETLTALIGQFAWACGRSSGAFGRIT